MNLNKIKDILHKFGDVLAEDYPTDKEYMLIMGNMLRVFGREHLKNDERLKDLNIDDANAVSLASMQYPDSVALAILLQSHVMIKLSDQFKDVS